MSCFSVLNQFLKFVWEFKVIKKKNLIYSIDILIRIQWKIWTCYNLIFYLLKSGIHAIGLINDAISKGDMMATLNALQLPAAQLKDVREQQAHQYLIMLTDRQKKKAQVNFFFFFFFLSYQNYFYILVC